jgi:hypothetical protein
MLSPVASLCLAAHAALPNGDRAFGWECDEAFDDQEWVYDRVVNSLHIEEPGVSGNPRCLDVDTNNYTDVQVWDCHYGANQQWTFRRVLLRGYGGLCLTRPNDGLGPVTMETCTGADSQLWRLEPGDYLASMRIRAENAPVCLAVTGGSGSSVVAEYCDGTFLYYLPVVAYQIPSRPARAEKTASGTSQAAAPGGQSFYLIQGGQIRLPTVAGPQYCFDVHDVWDSQFTTGHGGPEPGQRVQVFECLANQLNQRWNLTGDVVSGGKCLDLAGDATNNGAPAIVSTCDDSETQDWDYYW